MQTIHDLMAQQIKAGGPGSGPHPGGGAQQYAGSGKMFTGYHHHTEGEDRPYHILQGAGKNGGQWAAYEAHKSGGSRELAIFNSQQEASEHVHHSQG
jgi:hypothetical protein